MRRDFELHALVAGGLEGLGKLRDELGAKGIATLDAERLGSGHGN